jgi:hypothetical protein
VLVRAPRVVRVVTIEPGCREPLHGAVEMDRDAVRLRVLERSPGGACSAEIKVRCSELTLPGPIGDRRVVPVPRVRPDRVASTAAGLVSGPCRRLPMA